MALDQSRRRFLARGGTIAAALMAGGVGGCSARSAARRAGTEEEQPKGSTGKKGSGSIRFAWWGGEERQQAYTNVLKAFQKENSDVTVKPEFADYEPYHDRLATQIAAKGAPDVFWVAGFNVGELQAAGLYTDLEQYVPELIDFSGFDKTQLKQWRLDGKLNAPPFAIWNPVVRSDADLLKAAKIDVPDDATWTWDDLATLANDYARTAGEGKWGIAYDAGADLPFSAWIRQAGQELFTAEGDVGFDADVLGSWFAWWEGMRKAGGAMPLAAQDGTSPEWTRIKDRVAFKAGNANHLANDQPLTDHVFDNHVMPTMPDAAPGHRFMHLVRITVYSRSPNPEGAARFLNFFLNDPAVPGLVGVVNGLPPNRKLAKISRDNADETARKVIDVIERDLAEEMRPRPEVPPGASLWRDVLFRATEQVALEKASIKEASAKMVKDLQSSVERAR